MQEDKKYFMIGKKSVAIIVLVCIAASALFGFGGAFAGNFVADMVIAGTDDDAQSIETGSLFGGKRENGDSGDAGRDKNTIASAMNLADATRSEMSIQEIVELNENAVVEISTEVVVTDSWMMQYITEGAGSGVIISGDGYIMTNNHVIEDAKKITVRLKNGSEYEAALVGRDDETDVAVIKINEKGLTSAVYGDSDKLVVGELAVAIGNPLGKLGGTATAGIISALDRDITISGKDMKLLQTDASINPGNSGGGLFNQRGELIGIVVAKSTGSDVEGLGFAIPINTAGKIADEIIDNGYVSGRPDIGMSFLDLTSLRSAFYYGVRNLGIYVDEVYGEEAVEAGFQSGDMICFIDDKEIPDGEALTEAVSGYAPGDTLKVTILRDNRQFVLPLVMGEKTN